MKKNLKEMAEKSLKSFLKKKKIGYTTALLTAFLITGGIRLAFSTELASQETLLTNIEAQKSEIQAMLEENEKRLKELKLDQFELVRKGDFYSKPVYPSTQIFFTFNYENGGKGKDNTKSEWANTLEHIAHKAGGGQVPKGKNPYSAGELLSGYTESLKTVPEDELDPDINGNMDAFISGVSTSQALNLLKEHNGVYIEEPAWIASVELGANIIPLNPDLPTINKEISVSIGTPSLTSIPNPSVPTITAPTAPSTLIVPTISVIAPSSVTQITINAPTMPSLTVPGEKNITVPTVTTPSAVDPIMVVAPEAPESPKIAVPDLPSVSFTSVSLGNGTRYYADAVAGGGGASGNPENAIISNVAVIDGNFNIQRSGANSFSYTYSGYKMLPYLTASVTGVTTDASSTAFSSASTVYTLADISVAKTMTSTYPNGTGVQKVDYQPGVLTNANFTVARASENSTTNLGEFMHNDIHSGFNVTALTSYITTISGQLSVSDANKVTTGWNDAVSYATYDTSAVYWLNNGKIILEGGNLSVTNEYSHRGTASTTMIVNTGDLVIRPYISQSDVLYDSYNSVFLISNDTSGIAQHLWYNSGNIETFTNDTAAYTINSMTGANAIHAEIVNRRIVEMHGYQSVGIYARSAKSTAGSLTMNFTDSSGNRTPIVMTGDSSIGFYIPATNTGLNINFAPSGTSISGNFHLNIGDGNGNRVLNIAAGETSGGKAISNYYGDNINYSITEGTVGILSYRSMNLSSHGIIIYDATEGCIGVVPLTDTTLPTPTITLGNGSIEILGGKNNIGIIAMNVYQSDGVTLISNGGNVMTTGKLILDSGEGNVGAVVKNGYAINITSLESSGNAAANAIGLYAEGAGSTITASSGVSNISLEVSSPTSSDSINTMVAYAKDGATITMNRSGLSGNVDMNIQGAELTDSNGMYRGLGLMADNGTINAQYTYIKVTDGSAGVASINGGALDMSNSIIDVDRGYAVYNDSTSTINLTNTQIILGGTATAFDIDHSTPLLNLTGTSVYVTSNDVIVFNVKGLTTPLTLVGLSGQVTSGVTVTNDGIHTNYIEAAVDGATINIDAPLIKSATIGDSFYFYNRFIAQNSILNVDDSVTAELTSAQANNYKNQVIALEMNASRNATSNATTKINNNNTITAARTDTGGNGAVGAFINYGQLTNNGTINIQQGFTSIKSGTGVYATNGSLVTNAAGANINTYGEEGLGIYATAWREFTLGGYAGAEFGSSAVGQGLTTVVNNGNISTTGKSSVGIYMDNNSDLAGTLVAISGTNSTTGTITVGEDSIAMYARGNGLVADTTIGNYGTLVIGKNSAGMYGENAFTISNIGNLSLGEGAIGVVLDPNSTITVGGSVGIITSSSTGDKAVIAINGSKTLAPVTTTISLPAATMDLSGTTGVTGLYVQGASGAENKSGNLNLGTNGVGVYVNNGDASNTGIINMTSGKTSAVGMYVSKGEITNAAGGTIAVGDATQTGIAASGSDATAVNDGIINMNVTGATGIYVDKGATITDNAAGNLGFNAAKTFGIVSDNANVDLTGGTTLTLANSNESIYVYTKNNSTININGPLSIDGVADVGTQKSVGIYLDGTNTLNNNSTLTAEKAAIGIYANGANTLNGGTYTADGDKSVGVYFTNGGTLANAIVEAGNGTTDSAIGVYAAGGTITVNGNLNIDLQNGIGTGIYLSNGASMSGDTITITNTNASNSNIGIYYNGTSGTATHGTDVILSGGQRLVGIYANGGISVTNNKNITDNTIHDSVAVLVGGGSTYTGNGTLTGAVGGDTIGYYVNNGTAINNGTIDLTGTGTNSVAMVSEPGTGNTSIVKNTGTIIAYTSVGLLMSGTTGVAKGENTGTITVAATGTGVYLEGAGSSFDGTGGTISATGTSGSTAVGITLNGIGAGQVTNAGTLNLGSDSVGVYASNNSLIDFPLALTGTNGTGVFVQGGSTISGNVDGSQGTDVLSVYFEDATAILNNAIISTGQKGSSTSVGLYLGGTGQTYNLTSGTITVNNNGTVAINVATGNALNYGTGITTNVEDGAIGIYGTGAGTLIETQGGTLNINGSGIGIFVQSGATANVGNNGAIDVNFTGTGGALTFNDGGTVNLGTQINILSGSGTLAATTNGNLSNSGTINIGNGSMGLLGIYNAAGTHNITNTSTGVINVTNGGAGLAATGTTATVTVENQGQINVDGLSSVGMYSNIGGVDNTGGTISVTNGGIGIYVDGSGSIADLGTINVTGGVGYVVDSITLASAPTGNLTLNAGIATDYSIAGYYLNSNGTIVLPAVTQSDYSIIAAINGGINAVGNISTGSSSGRNQIGIYATNSNTTVGIVSVDGDENIGVFGENGTLTTGAITVGAITPSTHKADMSTASVGAYMKNGTLSVSSLDVIDNGIGAYGENANITTGAIQVGATGVGAYAKGTGVETLTVASLDIGQSSLGAYGKNTNVSVTGNMDIGNGTAVGIISEGNGDVNFNGIADIADKGTSTASIGIYKKDGTGTITSSGTFNVGDGGYGIYTDNLGSSSTATVNNSANMALKTSSVGIYASGQVVANNSGNIIVGSTDTSADTTPDKSDLSKHLNSLAMYGEKGAQLSNSGTITVNHEHSLGVYLKESGTKFTNTGTINVDNGSIGILATNFSTIVNSGTINLGYTAGTNTINIGVGIYGGTVFTNTSTGVINVGTGVGVYVGDATTFNNQGTINIDNGIGTSGKGILNNTGTIVIKDINGDGSATGSVKGSAEEGSLNNQGAITITADGNIIVNNQYVHSGSFVADGHVVVDNAVINITGEIGTIAVGSIEGNFVLNSSFLTTGNGYAWSVKDFLQVAQMVGITGREVTISGSPLYYATITAGTLEIAKQPYAYIVTGTQFDNLYNGLDSLLAQDQAGTGNDSQVLKNLNAYLDNIYNTQGEEAFNAAASSALAETRGDVYTTIQQRLNHVQGAFDSAFNELVSSHNFTKETGKYSVIYQQGSYEDKTLGVDDYDYRVQGLLYMQEYESRNYGNKWGYSLGFAVSRFDFDDSHDSRFGDKSKEDVYSLRAGIHNVHSFDEDDTWNLRTRLEIGYNRHETERTLELDKVYKNEGKYNSYNVSFDNRLLKTLYRSDRSELKIYGELNMEYGQIDGFTEKAKGDSGLELKLKDRDYYSIEGAIGIQGSTRAYIGKKISAKLTGDLSYGYDFGNSYDNRVKAKVSGCTEGWYNLIRPEEEKGRIKGNVGLTFEKADNYGVTFDLEVRKHENKKSSDVRYGLRFNYKFMNQ